MVPRGQVNLVMKSWFLHYQTWRQNIWICQSFPMIKDVVYAVSVVIQMVLKMTTSVGTQIFCCRYYFYIISHLVDLQYPDRYFCLWTNKSHHVILVGNIVLVNWNQKINQEIIDVYPLQWGPHIKDIPHWTIWWTKPEISCYLLMNTIYVSCILYFAWNGLSHSIPNWIF